MEALLSTDMQRENVLPKNEKTNISLSYFRITHFIKLKKKICNSKCSKITLILIKYI